MAVTLIFISFLVLALAVAMVDWRRGWLLAVVVGILQDPARKMTPGTPVVMSLSVVAVYAVVLLSSHATMFRGFREVGRRFAGLVSGGGLLILFLVVAAINGLATFGLQFWQVPALSFFIYLMPVPAVIFGYVYLQREEQLISFFRFYSILTAIALIGTPLEYLDYNWSALGMVGLPEGFIRYLPGVELKILSGFYRAPDIMGWHAATLTCIGIAMAVHRRELRSAWPWILAASWGFTNCILSGRRKAVYMVAVFAVVFVWRYLRRMSFTQLVTFAFVGVGMLLVVNKLGGSEKSSSYTRGTYTTREEMLGRLEGGVIETFHQYGIMGVGLGAATQGTQHLLGGESYSWQEGGLAKLAIEVGLPGIASAGLVATLLLGLMLKLSRFPDEPSSSQLVRVTLVALMVANITNFLASAQAYSDAVLTLITAFFLGCLLAAPALEDRAAVVEAPAVLRRPLTARVTA